MSGPDDMKKTPDDAQLENFLRGEEALTRAYRAGVHEEPPAELDKAVLKLAQEEAAKKPHIRRWEWPFAAAAVLVLSFSAVLSLRNDPSVQPALPETAALSTTAESEVAASPPAAAIVAPSRREESKAEARAAKPQVAPPENHMLDERALVEQDDAVVASPQAAESPMAKKTARGRVGSASEAQAPAIPEQYGFAGQAAPAESAVQPAAALSETQKTNQLIALVRQMQDVQFIRNGEAFTSDQAAQWLEQQRRAAGDKIQTTEDFIRLCVPPTDHVRYAKGAERPLTEVLREELRRIVTAPKE